MFMALMLPILIACVGMVIDVGWAYVQKVQLQNTADAAALAGVGKASGNGRARLVSEEEWQKVAEADDASKAEELLGKAKTAAAMFTAENVRGAWALTPEGREGKVVGEISDSSLKIDENGALYYKVALRDTFVFHFLGMLLSDAEVLPQWTNGVVAYASIEGKPGEGGLNANPPLEELSAAVKTQTQGSYQELYKFIQDVSGLSASAVKERVRWYQDSTSGIYYSYNKETGKVERYEYGYPGMEFIKDGDVTDEQGWRVDGQGKKEKYLNVRNLYIDFKPDMSKNFLTNWDVGATYGGKLLDATGNRSFGTGNKSGNGADKSRELSDAQLVDKLAEYLQNEGIEADAEKAKNLAKSLVKESYQSRIHYSLNFNRLYEVRKVTVDADEVKNMTQAEKNQLKADIKRETGYELPAEEWLWPYAVKNSDGETLDSDPLLIHIESEEINAGDGALSDGIANNAGGTAANSVREITINIQRDNTDAKYRPLVFSYSGPAVLPNTDPGTRVSQTVTLNLEEDFKGILFAPNSPVCIKGNGHKLRGLVVAEKFVDEYGNEIQYSSSMSQSARDDFYLNFGLAYSPSDPKSGYDSFGLAETIGLKPGDAEFIFDKIRYDMPL